MFQRTVMVTGFIIGLFLVIGLPVKTFATEERSPVNIDIAFENPRPGLHSSETLSIRISSYEDVPDASIEVLLPDEVRLASGSTTGRGSISKDNITEFSLKVNIIKTGRYSIFVNIQCGPDVHFLCDTRAHLNMIVSDQEVRVSRKPFIRMDLDRARTPEERENLNILKRGTEEIHKTPPVFIPSPTLPEFLKPGEEDRKLKDKKSGKESGLNQEANITVTVSGTMKYKDSAGTAHPIRYAKVQIIDVDGATNTIMGEGFTGSDGTYSIAATGGDPDSGPDIKVRVQTAIVNDLVVSIGSNTTSNYWWDSSTSTDYTGSTLSVSLTTRTPVVGSTTDSDVARAFSVLDAVLQFAVEAYGLRGNSLMEKIPVVYPGSGTGAFYSPFVADPLCPTLSHNGLISIARARALAWDVIGHEYGHFVADRGTSANFDQSCGGPHSGGSTIASGNSKKDGINLAWSEGWATYFSISAQVEPSSTAFGITLPNIPGNGNTSYNNVEAGWSVDIENSVYSTKGYLSDGYASESSIRSALFDLIDSNADTALVSPGLATDNIDLTPKAIWDLLTSGNWQDAGKFYNMLISRFNSVAEILAISDIFAMNNIAPEITKPANEDIISGGVPPTFKWTANGDPGATYKHNNFTLLITPDNFSTALSVAGITTNQYTPSDAEWEAVVMAGDANTVYKWVVRGNNGATPRIPLTGAGFVSNSHTFTIRQFHIKLTWDSFGSDVDLHFRPPDGASFSTWRYPNDSAFYNRTPDWGVAGDTTDNPSLDRDCITSCTEENTTIDKVVGAGTYKVLAHYYRDHGRGSTTARIEIFRYGIKIFDKSHSLSNSDDTPDSGQIWNALQFNIASNGSINIEEIDEVTVGDQEKLAPLPLKYRKPE